MHALYVYVLYVYVYDVDVIVLYDGLSVIHAGAGESCHVKPSHLVANGIVAI